jgi:hypothetical protein
MANSCALVFEGVAALSRMALNVQIFMHYIYMKAFEEKKEKGVSVDIRAYVSISLLISSPRPN